MTDDVRIPRLSTSHDASKQRLASDEKQRLDAAFDRLKELAIMSLTNPLSARGSC